MKTFLFFLFFFLGTSVIAKEFVAEGKTYTAMGDYKIITCDQPCIVNGDTLDAFTVMYENSPMEVKIAVHKDKSVTTYVVMSEKISITYVQHKGHFGIETIMDDKNINMEEYYHQRILTKGQSKKESMKLIAAYFPYLFSNV